MRSSCMRLHRLLRKCCRALTHVLKVTTLKLIKNVHLDVLYERALSSASRSDSSEQVSIALFAITACYHSQILPHFFFVAAELKHDINSQHWRQDQWCLLHPGRHGESPLLRVFKDPGSFFFPRMHRTAYLPCTTCTHDVCRSSLCPTCPGCVHITWLLATTYTGIILRAARLCASAAGCRCPPPGGCPGGGGREALRGAEAEGHHRRQGCRGGTHLAQTAVFALSPLLYTKHCASFECAVT